MVARRELTVYRSRFQPLPEFLRKSKVKTEEKKPEVTVLFFRRKQTLNLLSKRGRKSLTVLAFFQASFCYLNIESLDFALQII